MRKIPGRPDSRVETGRERREGGRHVRGQARPRPDSASGLRGQERTGDQGQRFLEGFVPSGLPRGIYVFPYFKSQEKLIEKWGKGWKELEFSRMLP